MIIIIIAFERVILIRSYMALSCQHVLYAYNFLFYFCFLNTLFRKLFHFFVTPLNNRNKNYMKINYILTDSLFFYCYIQMRQEIKTISTIVSVAFRQKLI